MKTIIKSYNQTKKSKLRVVKSVVQYQCSRYGGRNKYVTISNKCIIL